ncbi:MAG: hypothetical protein VB042_09495 [Victivallaceae bacterium]|nr:hypothetical protein [Victivallaceae bacterium]
MSDFSLAHVEILKIHVVELDLVMPPGFDECPAETLRRVYNGIGPDRFPRWLRKLVTWLLRPFEGAALIHDWEYIFQPKTYWAYSAANWRFARNALRTSCDALLPGQMVKTAICGLFLALLCQLFGWRGYKVATLPEEV